jgi:thiosulfate/3-mercaptopyruvate sulfurtransferase
MTDDGRRSLITTTELNELMGAGDLIIADVRWYLGEPEKGRAEYEKAHIPGAVYVHLEDDLCAPTGPGRHPLPDWNDFATTLGRLGVSRRHQVVAYDDRGGAIAARLWWMLRALGHHPVAVLDGGLTAWMADGHSVSAGAETLPPATYEPAPPSPAVVTRRDLAGRLGDVVLIDARARERYQGLEEPIDPVAGHIPGAVNAPYTDNLIENERFAPPASLAARFRALGAGIGRETVVYCGSGVTACHNILAMEVAGLGTATLYPGSWSDWSAAGGEVALGDY